MSAYPAATGAPSLTRRRHYGPPVGENLRKREPRGYDAGQKVMGRKRYIVVDTSGLLLAVVVHPADVQDWDGARLALTELAGRFSRLSLIWADGGYRGASLSGWVRERLGCRLEIVPRRAGQGYRIWNDTLGTGLFPTGGDDRIRNLTTNTVAFQLLKSGKSARQPRGKSICGCHTGRGVPNGSRAAIVVHCRQQFGRRQLGYGAAAVATGRRQQEDYGTAASSAGRQCRVTAQRRWHWPRRE